MMKIMSLKLNQTGQAFIEYILVLLVVVSICLGVMWQFNDAFRKFSNSYFGNYIACLLELGELPALGGSTSGVCASEYEPFDIANGRPKKGVGFNGGDDSDDDDSGSGRDKDGSGGSNSGDGSGGDVAGASGSAKGTDGVGRFGRFGANSSGRPTSVVIGTVKKDDVYTGSTESSSKTTNRMNTVRRQETLKFVDQSGGVIDPFENRKVKEASVTISKDTSNQTLKPKKARVDISRKVASADMKKDDTKFTLGDFLRYLLIAAIIIAVVIFIGGQALQVSKSWE
jgi:hypothetical protein